MRLSEKWYSKQSLTSYIDEHIAVGNTAPMPRVDGPPMYDYSGTKGLHGHFCNYRGLREGEGVRLQRTLRSQFRSSVEAFGAFT